MSTGRRRPGGGRRAWPAPVVALFGLLLSCAPVYGQPYLTAFAAGQRAMHAGRYDEAAKAFEWAAERALRIKDRDEARFMVSRALERAGRVQDAKRALEKLAGDSPDGPRTVRAEFELARLEIEHGNSEAGYAALYETARKHPKHGVSRLAIGRVRQHVQQERGEQAALAWLREIRPALKATELEQLVDYEIASALSRMDRLVEARDAFVATAHAHPYPFGRLTDDALWNASEIEERLGNYSGAIERLRELLAPRERADTMGSYERPRYSAAQFRIAELYRDRMNDHAAARREFHKLYTSHRTSILRDDALWQEARLAVLDGDSEHACSLVERLAQEFAESRYASCARALCPTASVKATKRPCAPYILRRLDPDRDAGGEQAPHENNDTITQDGRD